MIKPEPSIALKPDDPLVKAEDMTIKTEQEVYAMEQAIRDRQKAIDRGPEYIDQICNEWAERKYEQREIDG